MLPRAIAHESRNRTVGKQAKKGHLGDPAEGCTGAAFFPIGPARSWCEWSSAASANQTLASKDQRSLTRSSFSSSFACSSDVTFRMVRLLRLMTGSGLRF